MEAGLVNMGIHAAELEIHTVLGPGGIEHRLVGLQLFVVGRIVRFDDGTESFIDQLSVGNIIHLGLVAELILIFPAEPVCALDILMLFTQEDAVGAVGIDDHLIVLTAEQQYRIPIVVLRHVFIGHPLPAVEQNLTVGILQQLVTHIAVLFPGTVISLGIGIKIRRSSALPCHDQS